MFATQLLQLALINPKLLQRVAEAFETLAESGSVDPRAERIITAYEQCLRFAPSFRELKRAFIDEFGESQWRGDFTVRKTLRLLDLPIRESPRGRPTGSKSRI